MKTHQTHPIPPLYDANSKILILGSFPSVKSREAMFFYGHPQNRFWSVLAAVLGEEVPHTVEEKRKMVLKHNIAMWDVIASCDIEGSADSSASNVEVNDLTEIINNSNVTQIFTNGKTAYKYYEKYTEQKTGIKSVCLPSTSPANAAWSKDKLIDEWKIINKYL